MRIFRLFGALCAIGLPGMIAAQTVEAPVDGVPLSVIDWLGEKPKAPARTRPPVAKREETPVVQSALPPAVSVSQLGEGSPRAIGLVPANVTGIPQSLWSGSAAQSLAAQMQNLPELHLPAAHALLLTLLLAEATAPQGDAKQGDALALARVQMLIDAGALDPALSLIEQAGVATSPAHFGLWMQVSLLLGTEDRACDLLGQKPFLSADYGIRILCAARAGRWDDAALTLGSAQALKLLPPEDLTLLDLFLNPDLFDGSHPLPRPQNMSALNFRLLEAVGEPQPTRNLPPAFAVADLRDIVGWKAQLEAAERLTRIGVLPDNRFLGIYSDRRPAASGGIWDRVAALQRFDAALESGSSDAVTKTLTAVWHAVQEAELEVSFATLYAEALQSMTLQGASAELRDRIVLLSPLYERVSATDAASEEMKFLSSIAQGLPPERVPDSGVAAGIASAYLDPTPRNYLVELAQKGELGNAVLQTLALLEDGARGDTAALRDALSTLRALGLEDTARRASLQIYLLERD